MKPAVVLIVDDEDLGRKTLQGQLQSQGYVVHVAESGRRALAQAAAEHPDLILLDVMLPDLDGYEVCRRLRAEEWSAEIPVVMVTALGDRQARLRALDAGADDFLVKPFDREELRARVRTITRLNRYRKLHSERSQVAWVVEHSEDGYLWLDGDDRILGANPRARFLLGLDEAGPTDGPLRFRQAAERQYRPGPAAAWKDWPAVAPGRRYLVRPETPAARAFWLEVTLLQLPDGAGPRSGLVRLRDVTDRISDQRDMRGFHSAVHHKLRTPLLPILAGLQMLAERRPDWDAAEQHETAQLALQGATRLQEALTDILQFADLRKSGQPDSFMPVSELRSQSAEAASAMGLEALAIRIAPDVAQAQLGLTRTAWTTVLSELLDNAIKFHPGRSPRVTLSVGPAADRRLIVRVADDGQTLSPEQLAQAWTPYYQGERSFTGQWPGMGLGLAVVSALVLSAGGEGRLLNRQPGPGVVAELTVPEAPADEAPDRPGG